MLSLTDEQRMLVGSLRDLAENEFADRAFSYDGEEGPDENLDLLADRGFLGLNLPEEYGGGGLGEFEVLLEIDTVGRVCPDTASAIYGQSMVAPRAIEMFGSEAAKEKYLPGVTAGDIYLAIAISEPHAGSDSQNMNTHVVEENGELYLNGEKIWVSSVPRADAAVVWTKFPDGHLGTVIMEFDAPGVEIGEHYTNMHNGTQTHFFMEDVHVPEENVLVRGPEALKEQLKALNWERVGSSTYANAMSLCALDQAIEYANEREQFDQKISEFQGMRWKIAEMTQRTEAARSLAYRAAINGQEQGYPDRLEASLAKLTASQTVERVVSEALQVHGATGYQKGHPLEYLYRLARGRRIAAGTDELMKNNVADVVLDGGIPDLG